MTIDYDQKKQLFGKIKKKKEEEGARSEYQNMYSGKSGGITLRVARGHLLIYDPAT